jgi:uncharacterized protein (UPF0332 family)
MGIIDELEKKSKLKKGNYSPEMVDKEFRVGQKDLESAQKSLVDENYKWSIIQAYYAIFHAARALLFKSGYREESHAALKLAFKELFIQSGVLSKDTYNALERGMNLREMADYKETYSQSGAENLITSVKYALAEIEKMIYRPPT